MANTMVVTSDCGRARFFSYANGEKAGKKGAEGIELTEAHHMINEPLEKTESELFSNVKSGRNRGQKQGRMHPYDDHRGDHMHEFEKRFAQQVAHETVARAQKEAVERVVVVASPGMLGILRPALAELERLSVLVEELRRDVSKLSAHELHEYLGKQGVLPKRAFAR